MAPTNAEYAKINIACKSLAIDKYALIADRYGLETSKDLSRQQTTDLLLHFKTLGWKPKRARNSSKRSKTSPIYEDPMMRKVVALWITMADAKIVKNPANYAMQKYVKRMTGKDNLRWCDKNELRIIIEALKRWGEREAAPAPSMAPAALEHPCSSEIDLD
ncbi:regulatory protein GemA [Desulfocapsa sp. AH-315-G09]|uniref:Regulatory protein GemA n=1 Tax=Desulfotalea psychrophila TaxID=84980 RepID=A0ABS3AVQ3_9BACT|nr:regulatory protein GemA [Desulfocapsa sp.]MBN4065287.1 regulatory protein GemA [Desulfocapsa sp. AH-315-G09]MBN4068866.1 regulatory protein GemA [Desulfotalea psychrophila]